MTSVNDLKNAARLAAALNLLASVAMLFYLDAGLNPGSPIANRIAYIAQHQTAWIASWILWIFAAASLILFLTHWGLHLDHFSRGEARAWIAFGSLAGALGMIPDTIAESFYIGILPWLAKLAAVQSASDLDGARLHFQVWEEAAKILTGFLGNGLYCLGGLTLQILTYKTKALHRFCRGFGFVAWISGFGLSVATILRHETLLYATTALTMASFVSWAFLIGILKHPEPAA